MIRRRYPVLLLCIIVLIGSYLRLQNISKNLLYPDAYQNLLVARNIVQYHSPFGYLGVHGMYYPDFINWSRPGYALLIILFNTIIHNEIISAQLVSLITGIIGIIAAYLLCRSIFRNNIISLLSSLLLALSFNHISWGGYILTETTGVLFLLITLTLFFSANNHKNNKTFLYFLTGMFCVISILIRYEYTILLIPLFTYILFLKDSKQKFITLLLSITLFLLLSDSIIIPFHSIIISFFRQDTTILGLLATIILLSILLLLFIPYKKSITLKRVTNTSVLAFQLLLSFIIAIQLLINNTQILFMKELAAPRNFFKTEPLLGVASFIGVILLLRNKQLQSIALFMTASIVLLGSLYFKTNPEMQRYWTHLLPFIIAPAAYGLYAILTKSFSAIKSTNVLTKIGGISLLTFLSFTVIYQLNIDLQGIKLWGNGIWFNTSYEELSAKQLQKIATPSSLLITSLPEPYYMFTNISTHSITNTYPYIYINNQPAQSDIYIVQDMGMRLLFPVFNAFITNNLQQYKVNSYTIHKQFNYGAETYKETAPVNVYKISLKELQNRIQNTQTNL